MVAVSDYGRIFGTVLSDLFIDVWYGLPVFSFIKSFLSYLFFCVIVIIIVFSSQK